MGVPPANQAGALASEAMIEARAARLTDLLMVYAIMARQARTQRPRKPRMAPMQMKTVPSGRVDFCINGAAAVYGMTIVGMAAPAMVGRPVRWETEFVVLAALLEAPVVDEASVVVADPEDPEVAEVPEEADESVALDADVAVALLADVFSVAVLRLGKSVRVVASAARAKEPAKANNKIEALIAKPVSFHTLLQGMSGVIQLDEDTSRA